MGTKLFAVSAAVAAALAAAPAMSQEITRAPTTTFFVSIPLDASSHKEATPNFGLQFQGSKPYQAVKVDYQTFRMLPAALAAMEAKYVIAGAVAVGAAVAVAKKDSKTSSNLAAQQQQQAQACPVECATQQ
jgi:hypothetical protein